MAADGLQAHSKSRPSCNGSQFLWQGKRSVYWHFRGIDNWKRTATTMFVSGGGPTAAAAAVAAVDMKLERTG